MANDAPRHPKRGQTLIMFAIFVTALMGFSALAFDIAYVYLVRELAVAAADSAALASIRVVEQGLSEVTTVSQRTFNGNFPQGTLLVNEISVQAPTITPVTGGNEVELRATVIAPTTFARWFGQESFTINVRSTAVRRARNVALVLDNTQSIGSDFDELQTAAKAFVDEFDNSLDRVGLVSFARSARIEIMPDTNFKSALKARIDQLNMNDGYGTAAHWGLWAGHNALMGTPNTDGRPSDIVLFTDGRTNTCPAVVEVDTTSSYSSRKCSSSPVRANIGIASSYYSYSRWMAQLWEADDDHLYTGRIPECQNVSNRNYVVERMYQNFSVPGTSDPTYGLNGGITVSLWRGSSQPNLYDFSNNNYNRICQNFTMNLADQIRYHSTLDELTMHAIGYRNADSADLKAVVNYQGSASYDDDYPAGLYVYTDNEAQLIAAFQRVASSIGRLTQ